MVAITRAVALVLLHFCIDSSTSERCLSLPQNTPPKSSCSLERQLDLKRNQATYRLMKPPTTVDLKDYDKNLQKACLFPLMALTWSQVAELAKKDPKEEKWLEIYKYQLATFQEFLENYLRADNHLFDQFNCTGDFVKLYHTVRDHLTRDGNYTEYFRFPSLVEKQFQNITYCDHWKDDNIFVEQRLAGLNPMSIQKLTDDNNNRDKVGVDLSEIMEKLNWDFDWDAAMSAAVGKPTTLDEMIEDDSVFITHFPHLNGLTNVQDIMDLNPTDKRKIKKQTSPIALFVSTKTRSRPWWSSTYKLKPVAIQINSDKSSPVYQPSDGNKWLLAKLEFQVTDFLQVELVEHLLKTHIVMQPICIIAKRTLSKYHPLNPLLKQHCRGLFGANANGFPKLVLPGGYMHKLFSIGNIGAIELLNKAYKDLEWKKLGFEDDLKRRGITDERKLPYFPYRDDGELIWKEIKEYVEEYTELYYRNDRSVRRDQELRNFANELSSSGTGENGGVGQLKGFPQKISSVDELSDTLSRILWLPIQHNIVNYPIAYYGAFVPNMPTRLYDDPRAQPEEYSFSNLPDSHVATIQSVVSMSLGSLRYDKLLDYSSDMEDDQAASIVKHHHDVLKTTITKKLKDKNDKRFKDGHLTYPYLVPNWIPNSIHT